MRLTGYGRSVWLPCTVVAAALAAACFWWGPWWAALVPVVLWLAVAWFFRDPARSLPTGLEPGAMLSPSDGTISAVLRPEHHEITGGPALVIRTFLSVLNVHVNRAPCDGTVRGVRHVPGRFHDARTERSAHENQFTLISFVTPAGEPIGVRQVTGKVARRIVCGLTEGDQVQRGERFGMIRFGSTTELILPRPDQVQVHVNVGQKVRGGLTVLAVMAEREKQKSKKAEKQKSESTSGAAG
jgi:phosphatidylserine decarboxylase